MHDNKVLRFFKSHEARVSSVCMSPVSDNFLSIDVVGSLNIWDLRASAPKPVGGTSLKVPGRSLAAYDPSGSVIVAITPTGVVTAWDAKDLSAGPFDGGCDVIRSRASLSGTMTEFVDFAFSPDGKFMAVAGVECGVLVLDSFTPYTEMGRIDASSAGGVKSVAWTQDSTHVLVGCGDGNIQVWSCATLKDGGKPALVTTLGGHPGAVTALAWHPTRALLSSSCSTTAFWLPAS